MHPSLRGIGAGLAAWRLGKLAPVTSYYTGRAVNKLINKNEKERRKMNKNNQLIEEINKLMTKASFDALEFVFYFLLGEKKHDGN